MPQDASAHVKSSLTIKELPRSERPRERLQQFGERALTTAELVAILIGSGYGGRTALDVAHEILAHAGGSLRRIATQPVSALTVMRGVGEARAAIIRAALELGRRMTSEGYEEGASMRSPTDVYEVFGPRLQDLPVEELHVAILDAQYRLKRDVMMTRGILDSSLSHPREVFCRAIAEQAAAIILVHNHPSGDPTPSQDDKDVTEQLVAAGMLVDIPVHDHIIIGRGRYTSFAQEGWL